MNRTSQVIRAITERVRMSVGDDASHRRMMFAVVNVALCTVSLFMSVINIFTAESLLIFSTLAFCALCAFNLFMLHIYRSSAMPIYILFTVESTVLIAIFYISGLPSGFSTLWACLIPSFALLVFGLKFGSVFSAFTLAMIIFLFWTPTGRGLLWYDYGPTFMMRFPFLYSAVFLIALLMEFVRIETNRQLLAAREKYRDLSLHDALTGLYNRYGGLNFLGKVDCGSAKASVLIIDIDDFKRVNDRYGHAAGDAVLRHVAQTVRAALCEHCVLCRWGGEEFLAMMMCDHDPAVAAEQIRSSVERSKISFEGKELSVTVSVGVCITGKDSGANADDIINCADKCLYEAKGSGKNRCVCADYDPSARQMHTEEETVVI